MVTTVYRVIFCALASLLILAGTALPARCGEGTPRVIWKTAGLGKPTSEIQMGPNGLLYLSCGSKLAVLHSNGNKLWELGLPGESGPGVFDGRGSIFFSGNTLVQEFKINGGAGWSFTFPQGTGPASISAGPGSLLYLSLPMGLYALNTEGRSQWTMLEWDSEDANRSLAVTDREILAAAGNSKAVFVIHGRRGKGHSLTAVNGRGEIIWNYHLGKLKSARLAAGKDGRIYVTANPDKVDKYNRGKVYAFDSETGTGPVWTYQVALKELSTPTPAENGLVYFCAEEKLFALDQADGTEKWRNQFNKKPTRPAVDEATGRVYLGTDGDTLLALSSQKDGRLDWSLSLDGKVTQPPVIINGHIYVVSDKGTLYKIRDEL